MTLPSGLPRLTVSENFNRGLKQVTCPIGLPTLSFWFCCLGLPQSFVCRGGVGCVVHVCAGLVLAVWIGLLPLCDLFVFPRCFWVLLPSAIAPAQPGNKSNRNDLIIWSGHCFSWFSNPSKSFSWIHFGRSFGLFGNFVFGLLLPEFFDGFQFTTLG